MGRGGGGRSSGGGGRRSYSAPRSKAHAPAPKQGAPAPATASTGGGSLLGTAASAITESWLWGAGSAMGHRAMDAVFGPRTFRVEHTHDQAPAAGGSSPSSPCDVHAHAFQDCINHNGSDISKCQFYVDILNDCRRNGQVAVVQPYA